MPSSWLASCRRSTSLFGPERADDVAKSAFQLPDRDLTIVGQLTDAILALGAVQQLGRGLNELQIILSQQGPLNQKLLQPRHRRVVVSMRDLRFQPLGK